MRKPAALIFFSLCIVFLCSFNALAVDLRVLLGTQTDNQKITVYKGQYKVVDTTYNIILGTVKAGEKITCRVENDMLKLRVNGVDIPNRSYSYTVIPADENCIITYNNLHYRDGFNFIFYGDSRINALNIVEMEHYLYGVVGREIGYNVHIEALKAQAVVSRTYAAANINPNRRYDVVATISSQVYGGYDEESKPDFPDIKKAVDATKGEILLYDGEVFPAYFSANAGGYTESIENVWGETSSVPFAAVPSPYDDNGSSSYIWTINYTKEELLKRVNDFAGEDIGDIKDIIVTMENPDGSLNKSGRAYKVEVVGTNGTATALRDKIRALLGLKSTIFDLEFMCAEDKVNFKSIGTQYAQDTVRGMYAITAAGENFRFDTKEVNVIGAGGKRVLDTESVSDITVNGYGHGHGVGMSQHGAKGMADAGYSYKDIIKHYYFNNDKFTFGSLNAK